MADRASIFLLEDETLIRLMIAEIVEGLGHRVVAEAGTIDEGIRLAQAAEFDLALLDINIDGDTSAEIAKIIERRGLPFLFVTGYRSTGLAPPFHDRLVLQKPFQTETLRSAIDESLRQPKGMLSSEPQLAERSPATPPVTSSAAR
jgi:CheY-like chemotaxis protein